MWVRSSAIRPVSPYARVSPETIEGVRNSLAEDNDEARAQLDEAFARFERSQPLLAGYLAGALGHPLDDTALALGYFLALTVWLSFERAHGGALRTVLDSDINATDQLLALDEELRRTTPEEALDSDDVIAMEQPAILDFVHEHIDATLESHADEVNVDDVHRVYRTVLVEVLALSYAVRLPTGYPVGKTELLA